MEKMNLFENGKMVISGIQYNIDNIEWNPHPAFKGVSMKHIIKGADTNGRLSCHIVKIDPECEIGNHIHEGKLELHEVVTGHGRGTIGEESFDYSAGMVSYIPDDIKHSVKAGKDGMYILAKFSPALI